MNLPLVFTYTCIFTALATSVPSRPCTQWTAASSSSRWYLEYYWNDSWIYGNNLTPTSSESSVWHWNLLPRSDATKDNTTSLFCNCTHRVHDRAQVWFRSDSVLKLASLTSLCKIYHPLLVTLPLKSLAIQCCVWVLRRKWSTDQDPRTKQSEAGL